MRGWLKSKRAVSPVFSTVLLILLVVAGMTVVFAFLVSYVEDYQTGQGSAVLENFVIENVWFIKDTNNIEITIFNYGKIDINITSIHIDGLAVPFSFKNHDNFDIPAGEHRTAITTKAFTSNTAYHFKIITLRGSPIESQFVSPMEASP